MQKYLVLLLFIAFSIVCKSEFARGRQRYATKSSPLESVFFNSYLDIATYRPPSEANVTLARDLFSRILESGRFTEDDVASWSTLGLTLRRLDHGGQTFAVISQEPVSTSEGQGFFVIRLLINNNTRSSDSFIVVEAPHRPSDMYTHEIAFHFLTRHVDIVAGAWSTTHRDNVDLCKANSSYFNAFTEAVADVSDNPKVIQIHGFNKDNYDTDADVIYSSTKRQFPPIFEPIASCLEQTLVIGNYTVKRYPDQVDFLGGTLNINAARFYAANPNGMFFHVETSKPLREALRINAGLSNSVAFCFLGK